MERRRISWILGGAVSATPRLQEVDLSVLHWRVRLEGLQVGEDTPGGSALRAAAASGSEVRLRPAASGSAEVLLELEVS